MKLQIIYLAAGNSRRFGKNKLMHVLDGKPMYLHLLERLVQICQKHPSWQITVVTQYHTIYNTVLEMDARKEQESHVDTESTKINAVYSCDSSKGISYSIRAGIKASAPDTEAYAFFVADQPYLTGGTAEKFLCRMEKEKASLGSAACKGKAGNPAWFSCRYTKELILLEGDTGGRFILKKYSEKVLYYEVENDKELIDIDTSNIQ